MYINFKHLDTNIAELDLVHFTIDNELNNVKIKCHNNNIQIQMRAKVFFIYKKRNECQNHYHSRPSVQLL